MRLCRVRGVLPPLEAARHREGSTVLYTAPNKLHWLCFLHSSVQLRQRQASLATLGIHLVNLVHHCASQYLSGWTMSVGKDRLQEAGGHGMPTWDERRGETGWRRDETNHLKSSSAGAQHMPGMLAAGEGSEGARTLESWLQQNLGISVDGLLLVFSQNEGSKRSICPGFQNFQRSRAGRNRINQTRRRVRRKLLMQAGIRHP